MKKSCGSLLIVLVYSALRLYGLDGSAVISADKAIQKSLIGVSESAAGKFPLNSNLVIINKETGIGTAVTVVKTFPVTAAGTVVELSQYVADTIGFKEKSGTVTLLTLAELTRSELSLLEPAGFRRDAEAPAREVSEAAIEPPAQPPAGVPAAATLTINEEPARVGTPLAESAVPQTPAAVKTPMPSDTPSGATTVPPHAVLSLVPAGARPPPSSPDSGLPPHAEVAPLPRKDTLVEAPIDAVPPGAEVAPLTRRAAPARTPLAVPPEAEAAPLARSSPVAPLIPRLPPEREAPEKSAMPEITLPAEVPAPPRNPSPPPARSASAPAGPMTNIPPTITASRPSTVPPDTAPAPRTQSSLPARLPPEAEIAPIGTVSVMSGSAAPLEIPRAGQGPSVPARAFSVPQIKSLEKGAYYLQLAALSKAELVEPELARIGRTYPLVIQTVENQGRLLYRILLGPVSSGESRALLSRFKGVGYADAFIRHES